MYCSFPEETIISLEVTKVLVVPARFGSAIRVLTLEDVADNLIVLTQLSLDGDRDTKPLYETTWNGFTFSTFVANGCSIQSTLSYFKVIAFPVFCTLESKRSKF